MDRERSHSLDSALRGGALYHRAPPDLRARVLDRLPHAPAGRTTFALSLPAWSSGLLAGAAASLLILGAGALFKPAPMDPLERDIVSSHVRALLSQRAIDVASSDKHTVKPWFNGRIDYAPPVLDLAALGFPLEGGRVDYVAHRTVAVLTYRYQKHPIDLYVFPDTGGSGASVQRVADGYSVARWHQGGMTYWAITDADATHLRAFEQALQTLTIQDGNPAPH